MATKQNGQTSTEKTASTELEQNIVPVNLTGEQKIITVSQDEMEGILGADKLAELNKSLEDEGADELAEKDSFVCEYKNLDEAQRTAILSQIEAIKTSADNLRKGANALRETDPTTAETLDKMANNTEELDKLTAILAENNGAQDVKEFMEFCVLEAKKRGTNLHGMAFSLVVSMNGSTRATARKTTAQNVRKIGSRNVEKYVTLHGEIITAKRGTEVIAPFIPQTEQKSWATDSAVRILERVQKNHPNVLESNGIKIVYKTPIIEPTEPTEPTEQN